MSPAGGYVTGCYVVLGLLLLPGELQLHGVAAAHWWQRPPSPAGLNLVGVTSRRRRHHNHNHHHKNHRELHFRVGSIADAALLRHDPNNNDPSFLCRAKYHDLLLSWRGGGGGSGRGAGPKKAAAALASSASIASGRKHLVDEEEEEDNINDDEDDFNAKVVEEDEEADDDEEEEEDEDDYLLDMDHAAGLDESDNHIIPERGFAEETTLERMMDAWTKTPPLTKGYLSLSFAATVMGYIFEKNEFPSILSLKWRPVLQRMQLWRLFTSFLNFGPLGLGYLMTAQFVWTYMSTLERLHHDRPYDFWIMILFGQISMVLGYPLLRQSPRFLGHNLSTYLVYIWSRYHEGVEVNMFELFNARAELLPWFFLAQTFLLEGELPILDLLGILFGHFYHHAKTVGLLRAPPALVRWYQGPSPLATRIREQYKVISSDFEMI